MTGEEILAAREPFPPCKCWKLNATGEMEWHDRELVIANLWEGLLPRYVPTAEICYKNRKHAILHIKLESAAVGENIHCIDLPLIDDEGMLLQSRYCFAHRRFEQRLKFGENNPPETPVTWVQDCDK